MLCRNFVKVKAYPGELIQLKIVPLDEQNSTSDILVRILEDLTNDNAVSMYDDNLICMLMLVLILENYLFL